MAYHPFRNIGLKLLATCLAVLLWFMVARDPIVERTLRVPFHFQNVPAGLTLVGAPPEAVEVRVRGSAGLVSGLQPDEVVALLNLQAARQGRRLFHLLPSDVRVPFGIDIEQIVPANITLEFERLGSKVVPVKPVVEGQPAAGFIVAGVSSSPPSIEVVGPESRLALLAAATTEPVSIAGATTTVKDVVSIGTVDPSLRLRAPVSATVTASILAGPLERVVRDVPVRPRSAGRALTIEMTPPQVAVRVRGVPDAVIDLADRAIEAFVDLAGREPGRYDLPVQTTHSGRLEVLGVLPPTVTVTVR